MTEPRGGGATPGPEAELALLLAGTRDRRELSATRIAELAAVIDESALTAFLASQRLTLLAGTRLRELAPEALSPRLLRRLDQALTAAQRRAMVFGTVASGLTDALESAGVPALTLKGAPLAAELHGDGALRDYVDIDVLVAGHDLDRAVRIAAALGWDVELEPPPAGSLPLLHRALLHRAGALPELELHWRIHWYESDFAAGLLRRTEVIDGVRRIQPLDQFAALLLFYARDGFAGLRLAADLGAWWDLHGTVGTPADLEQLAARHPTLAEAWRTAFAVATAVTGMRCDSIPETLLPRSRRARLARRLVNWDLHGDPDQIMANVTLIDGLLAPREDLGRFLHRQTMRRSADGTTPDRAAQPVGGVSVATRTLHFAKTIARHALALTQLRAGRSWSPLPPIRPSAGIVRGRDR